MEAEIRPVVSYDIKEELDRKGNVVYEFRAHYLKETPEEEIEALNARWNEWKTYPQ